MEDFLDDKTTKKAKNIIVKTACSMIPGVGKIISAAYELKELMKERAREIKNKEVEGKMNDFHDRLFENEINVNDSNQESFFTDYTKIIENLIRDDETEKAAFYANMLAFFTNQDIRKDEKIFLLTTLKYLTNFEIGVVQKAIIAATFPLTADPLPRSSYIFEPALKKIVQRGLFDRDGDDIAVTKAGDLFASSIFLPKQLLPEVIGGKIFRANTVSILFLYDLDKHSEYKIDPTAEKVKTMLRNESFRVKLPVFLNSKARKLDNKPLIFNGNILILIYDKHFEPVKWRSSLEKCNLIKIYMKDDETDDPLKDLTSQRIISFIVNPRSQEIDSVIQQIGEKHLLPYA